MIKVIERWCYRRMVRISWTEHVTNEEVFNRAKTKPTLLDGLLKRRLAFHGHLVRTDGITFLRTKESNNQGIKIRNRNVVKTFIKFDPKWVNMYLLSIWILDTINLFIMLPHLVFFSSPVSSYHSKTIIGWFIFIIMCVYLTRCQ